MSRKTLLLDLLAALSIGWLLYTAFTACAQWGGRNCSPVGEPLRWVTQGSESYLFRGNTQIGGYDHASKTYRAITGDCPCGQSCQCKSCACGWSEPCRPPIAPPPDPVSSEPGDPPTGVDWDKIPREPTYKISGKKATLGEVKQKLIEGLDDDSQKPHLTLVVKDAALRKKLQTDLKALSDIAAGYRIQVYDPASPIDQAMLEPFQLERDQAFQKSGTVVLVQQPAGADGKSKPRAIYAFGGPEDLAEQIRKKDPDYDPNKKTPDERKPLLPLPKLPAPNINFTISPWVIVAILALLALALMVRKPNQQ
jgi:hypothetical protein